MYIGRIGDGSHYDDGCYILLKEVIDNAIDEFIMGHGKEVQIKIEDAVVTRARFRPRHSAGQGGGLRLQDQHRRQVQRRRVPVQRGPERRRHQGGQRALEGVSSCAAIASGEFVEASFKQGKLKNEKKRQGAQGSRTARSSSFEPDPEIFKEVEFQPEHVERRLRHYSYLNTGLKLVCTTARPFSRATACWTW